MASKKVTVKKRSTGKQKVRSEFILIGISVLGLILFFFVAKLLPVSDSRFADLYSKESSYADTISTPSATVTPVATTPPLAPSPTITPTPSPVVTGNTTSDTSICTADRATIAMNKIVYGKRVYLRDLLLQQAQSTKPLFNFVSVFGSGPVTYMSLNNMLFDRGRERALAGFLSVKKYQFANTLYFSGLNTSKTPETSTEMAFDQSQAVSNIFGTLAASQYVIGAKACSTVGNVTQTQSYNKSVFGGKGNVLIVTSEFHIPRVLWLLNYYKFNAQVLSADEVLQSERVLNYAMCIKQPEVDNEKSQIKTLQSGFPGPSFIESYACLTRS